MIMATKTVTGKTVCSIVCSIENARKIVAEENFARLQDLPQAYDLEPLDFVEEKERDLCAFLVKGEKGNIEVMVEQTKGMTSGVPICTYDSSIGKIVCRQEAYKRRLGESGSDNLTKIMNKFNLAALCGFDDSGEVCFYAKGAISDLKNLAKWIPAQLTIL
jgi:hypothetical protein